MNMTDRNDHHNNNDFDFSKDLDVNVDVDLNFDVDVDVNVDIDKYVNINICSDVDIHGNTAELTLDAEAIGDNTLVESIVSVLTTDDLSSISLSVLSAVD
jgi:hypothetical protein